MDEYHGYHLRRVPADDPCWTDEDGEPLDKFGLLDAYGFRNPRPDEDGFVIVDCCVIEPERSAKLPGEPCGEGYRRRRVETADEKAARASTLARVYRRSDGRSLRAEVGRERGSRPTPREVAPEDVLVAAREKHDDPDHPCRCLDVQVDAIEPGDVVEETGRVPPPFMAEPDR